VSRAGRVALALAAVALAGTAASPAQARWSDAQLASVHNERLEQADGATAAVDLSGDGRWVVFQSAATNFFADDDADQPGTLRRGGVFRFDRTSGRLDLVADGDLVDEQSGELLRRGAAAPSVSDDGRRVVFSTAQRLVPQDVNDNVDVYVRDMAVPLGADRAAGAYVLVSARDGGDEPATYAPRETPLPGRNPGAATYAGAAISGDGRHVVFRTPELASDLPDRPAADTPAGNVFVRDLVTRRTVLVSRTLDGAGAAGGALAPVTISADGSTVAWVGGNAPRQTPMVLGESLDDGQPYYLWRRWDEPGPTRRITGLADPDDPACRAGFSIEMSPVATGPCYGALAGTDSGFADISSRAPALSADGWTVAFLSGSGARPAQDVDVYLDAYVTSMRPGLSRKQATRVVTRGTTAPNPLANGDLESVALSGDGRRLLVVTGRRQFLPPAPELAGDPRSTPGSSELYAIDLDGRTRRVLRPGGDGDVDGAVETGPALSRDGRTVAFVTRAANLVRGDANELADALVVEEVDDPPSGAPPSGIGEDPADVDVVGGGDDFAVRASVQRDGRLRLRVTVPAAGAVTAVARTRPVAKRSRRTRARRKARAARPRRVASGRASARRATTVTVTLTPSRRDLKTLRGGVTLPVRAVVTFRPRAGGRARTAAADAVLRVRGAASRPARRAAARGVRRAARALSFTTR
jgi:Tol biopolymer transport system component